VESRPTASPGRPRVRLTGRDLELLAFVAEHRLVVAEQVQALLGISGDAARARLRALTRGGLVASHRPFAGQRACYQIRSAGVDAIAGDLRPPRRLDLRTYEHELGAAWLWLAARRGTFGALREVVGERRLRSADATAEGEPPPYGVRLGGLGAGGRERLHYPDLLLITPEGRRIALELELSSKGRRRRERILAGYGADARIDAVLYLVKDRRLGTSIRESARRLGLGALVHVQQVSSPAGRPSAGRGRVAERSRAQVAAR
jgi:hypothetical protein